MATSYQSPAIAQHLESREYECLRWRAKSPQLTKILPHGSPAAVQRRPWRRPGLPSCKAIDAAVDQSRRNRGPSAKVAKAHIASYAMNRLPSCQRLVKFGRTDVLTLRETKYNNLRFDCTWFPGFRAKGVLPRGAPTVHPKA